MDATAPDGVSQERRSVQRCGNATAAEVHHLGPLTDNDPGQLLAVCKSCHLALEAEKRG